ncbi:hypothetical protein SFMTTN_2275 [Sulfuriferula multivorans]|uniref:Uncharacterized protein n=1 Tax=Sulfuriferula multivorans TaxID=1559896 RepID=A0A401JFP7_9PROT|nr:hypothetical protein [Sulfuriferula multivorans]GBL46461.1 hypothetical protein SFMTTN_2275 [Sulfuriferula multivorans]
MTDRTTTTPETDAPVYSASQSPECITDAGDKCSRNHRTGLADLLEFKQRAKSIQPSAIPDGDPAARQDLLEILVEMNSEADLEWQERKKMQESSDRRHIDAIDAAHETHRAMNAIKGLLVPTAYVPANESGLDMVNRDDLYALLAIVNGHLGRALEMASDSDGKR